MNSTVGFVPALNVLPVRGSGFGISSKQSKAVPATAPFRRTEMVGKPNGEQPELPRIPQGFTAYSELLNGRVAMMGFALGLITELITGQGMLAQVESMFKIVDMANALSQ